MKDFFKNKWVIGIGVGLIIIIARFYITKDGTDTFFGYLLSIPVWIWGILSFKVGMPIWSLILIAGWITLLLIGSNRRIKNEKQTIEKINKDDAYRYTSDKFGDLFVRWSWESNYLGELHCRCPDHPTVNLERDFDSTQEVCAICKEKYWNKWRNNESRLRKIILHNAQSGDRGLPEDN